MGAGNPLNGVNTGQGTPPDESKKNDAGQIIKPEGQKPEDQKPAVKSPEENYRDALVTEKEAKEQAERKADLLEQMLSNQNRPVPEKPPDPTESDEFLDDWATNRSVKQMLDTERAKDSQDRKQRDGIAQEMRARETHPDWDTVVMKYAKELFNKPENAGLYESVMNSPNPAELAYSLGKTHPDYLQVITEETSKQVAGKINENLQKPPTLASMGGGNVNISSDDDEIKAIGKMSNEDFKKTYIDKFKPHR